MTNRTIRTLTMGLLASAAFVQPVFAQDAPAPAAEPQPEVQAPPAAPSRVTNDDNDNVIIVTATKREENMQDVPVSIQAIGTKRLDQLNISNFEDFTKQLPSVSFQTSQPGSTTVYVRGVATGGDGNHSGPLPSVGFYLDEQPITTIGGTLDVHIYDIARIESLAGPQGTLYGASSEAGTIRIITNKPELGITTGRIDAEINNVAHGDWGGSVEGMINLPVSDNIALRAVAFYQRDAGYIDNVFGERTYTYTGTHSDFPSAPRVFDFDNSEFLESNFNDQRIYGGRAALKIDLDENWTVTPTIMHQNAKSHGVFYMDQSEDDLDVVRFKNEVSKDKFTQVALTIEGKIGNFDITYAGAYMDRPTYGLSDYTDYTDAYDAYYAASGGILDYQYFFDNAGNVIDPRQYITGGNHFKKLSQELRIASPTENRFRVIAGAFFQRQSNDILQEYRVDGLSDLLSVNGQPGMIWLTKQERVDKDYALFGEASFDVTPEITLTGGGRYYKFNNTLFGFAGFGRNPDFFQGAAGNPPPNAVFSTRTGVAQCFTESGLSLRDAQLAGADTTLILDGKLGGTPCINVGDFKDGKIVPRRSKDDGFLYRFNGNWKPNDDMMFYATVSKGYRPGGINRQPGTPAFAPDFLTNYELGWKTTLADGAVRWNGAIYHQLWKDIQFAYLGENSLTIAANGRKAKSNGIETDVSYVSGGLTLTTAAAYTDAKTKGNICNDAGGNSDCDGPGDFVVTPSGTRLPITPKFKAAATARYAWPWGAGRAHVQGSIAYQGSATADIRRDADGDGFNPNDVLGKTKASTLVDFFTGYDWNKHSVELFVTNLFDERNELSRFVVCSICTQTKIVPGRPRTIGLRVGTKF